MVHWGVTSLASTFAWCLWMFLILNFPFIVYLVLLMYCVLCTKVCRRWNSWILNLFCDALDDEPLTVMMNEDKGGGTTSCFRVLLWPLWPLGQSERPERLAAFLSKVQCSRRDFDVCERLIAVFNLSGSLLVNATRKICLSLWCLRNAKWWCERKITMWWDNNSESLKAR